MFKKSTKFFAGIALLVQALTALIMFFIKLGQKKHSGAWLALAAITGAAGGYLVYDSKDKSDRCEGCECDEDCDDCSCEGDCNACTCNDEDVDIDEGDLFSRNEEEETEADTTESAE